MNELKVFTNPAFGEIRTISVGGEPWFVAADVCKALELGNSRQALTRLEDDEKGVISNDTPGGEQQMSTINEAGLYSLVLGSRKPEAKAFRRWITHEVIPDIRKHGAYMTPETIEKVLLNPDTIIRLATDLKDERAKRLELQGKIETDAPKVLFADAVSASHTSILIGELAKIIKQNGVDMGQNRLFTWMRDNGYLVRRGGTDFNTPTQKAMEMGLFEIKETAITHSDGHVSISKTTKVTGKGQQYFINSFLGRKEGAPSTANAI